MTTLFFCETPINQSFPDSIRVLVKNPERENLSVGVFAQSRNPFSKTELEQIKSVL